MPSKFGGVRKDVALSRSTRRSHFGRKLLPLLASPSLFLAAQLSASLRSSTFRSSSKTAPSTLVASSASSSGFSPALPFLVIRIFLAACPGAQAPIPRWLWPLHDGPAARVRRHRERLQHAVGDQRCGSGRSANRNGTHPAALIRPNVRIGSFSGHADNLAQCLLCAQ